ncbi:MAG TPA: DUF58 domain-containing protein, partial [Ktedonobacterales bacterium]|nr:DUF58 domain-containing protein [Ktedonobacterales bacterium]
FMVGVASHQSIGLAVGVCVFTLSAAAEFWYHLARRRLEVTARWLSASAFLGETTRIEVRAENRKSLPLPWVTVGCDLPEELKPVAGKAESAGSFKRYLLIDTLALWSNQGVTRHHVLRCTQRGIYRMGSITVQTSDPLGWLGRKYQIASSDSTFMVYPRIASFADLRLPALAPFGDLATPRHLLEDPARLAGVREYQPGDDPRFIHWKASAHANVLQRKMLDASGQYRMLILLDVNSYQEARYGIDPDFLELSICIAASLANWAIDKGYPTGLLSNATLSTLLPRDALIDDVRMPAPAGDGERANIVDSLVWLAPTMHRSQRERLLSLLALVVARQGLSVARVLDVRQRWIPQGTSIFLVSTTRAIQRSTIERLAELHRRGIGVHLILIGSPNDLRAEPTYDLPVNYVNKEVWYALDSAGRPGGARGTDGAIWRFTLD